MIKMIRMLIHTHPLHIQRCSYNIALLRLLTKLVIPYSKLGGNCITPALIYMYICYINNWRKQAPIAEVI